MKCSKCKNELVHCTDIDLDNGDEKSSFECVFCYDSEGLELDGIRSYPGMYIRAEEDNVVEAR